MQVRSSCRELPSRDFAPVRARSENYGSAVLFSSVLECLCWHEEAIINEIRHSLSEALTQFYFVIDQGIRLMHLSSASKLLALSFNAMNVSAPSSSLLLQLHFKPKASLFSAPSSSLLLNYIRIEPSIQVGWVGGSCCVTTFTVFITVFPPTTL